NQSAVIEEVSSEEAAGVMGGNRNGNLMVKYEVVIQKVGKKSVLKRILTNKSILRVTKLKNGVYTVRYREEIKRQKKTSSQGNSGFRPANNFF
ncbi:MAG: hypothetical protein KDA74_18485, partial [Planctomycetaceae bacterium]|nr:hypothetical protein [Planctomycetaceae bacterium]